jgi:hypothetical protein
MMDMRRALYAAANGLTTWAIRAGVPRPPYTCRNAIMVETIGRRSGKPRRVPVGFVEAVGLEARRQHHLVNVLVREPGVRAPVLRPQPARLDLGSQRNVAGQPVDHRARLLARRVQFGPFEDAEPDRETQFPEREAAGCLQAKLGLRGMVAQADERRRQERLH